MKIGIDARSLVGKKRGVGNYLDNLLEQFQRLDRENEYYLYAHRAFTSGYGQNGRWHLRIKENIFSRAGTLWMNTTGRRLMLEDKLDVFWSVEGVLPVGLPRGMRKIITICDLVEKLYPRTMNIWNRLINLVLKEYSIKSADAIVAISRSTIRDLREYYPKIKREVLVAYPGASDRFKKIAKDQAKRFIKDKYGIASKYLLAVGTLEPRKNLGVLIRAFARLKPADGLKLVVCGAKGWKNSALNDELRKHAMGDNIVFPDYVPSDDLPYFYSGAEIMIFPSLYEGFGMPIVECYKCGTAVILSDIPVFREIAGAAGIYFDPHDPAELGKKIIGALNSPAKLADYAMIGSENAAIYDWDGPARVYLNAFKKGRLTC